MKTFFEMGGYAIYVWPSFGIALLLMAIEPLLLRRRKTLAVKRIRRLQRMNEARG